MPITFVVKIVWPKVHIIFSQSDDLNLQSRSPLRLKLDKCFTGSISRTIFKLWHSTLVWGYTWHILMLVSMTLTLMQGHGRSAKAKIQRWIISTTEHATSVNLATTIGLFFYVTLNLKTFIKLYHFLSFFYFLQARKDYTYIASPVYQTRGHWDVSIAFTYHRYQH